MVNIIEIEYTPELDAELRFFKPKDMSMVFNTLTAYIVLNPMSAFWRNAIVFIRGDNNELLYVDSFDYEEKARYRLSKQIDKIVNQNKGDRLDV